MEKIWTAKDYARMRHGVQTVRERIRALQALFKQRHGLNITIRDLDGEPSGAPVLARIWQGAWIADCECGGAEFVDYDEPIFFCFCCGNRANANRPRPVIFPEEREAIEQKILERPVDTSFGLDELQQAEAARPKLHVDGKPLTRSWRPGETLEDLAQQQDEAIAKAKGEENGIR
jgi:hypothetical protein